LVTSSPPGLLVSMGKHGMQQCTHGLTKCNAHRDPISVRKATQCMVNGGQGRVDDMIRMIRYEDTNAINHSTH
jgi:hypothetical protein